MRSLEQVWNALERQGAVVDRFDTAGCDQAVIERIREGELRRLAILAEAHTAGPSPIASPEEERTVRALVARLVWLLRTAALEAHFEAADTPAPSEWQPRLPLLAAAGA